MFREVTAMMQNQVSGDEYDEQIILWSEAAVRDLETSTEIVLPGRVSITRTLEAATTSEPEHWVITDNSTLKDRLAICAIATYCCMNIGNPPNYENLRKAYESLKGQMRLSRNYTRYGGASAECG